MEGIGHAMRDTYVLPKVGESVAQKMAQKQIQGQFSHINTKLDFIKEVTELLQNLSGDRHLSAQLVPKSGRVSHVLKEEDEKRVNNFAFEQVRILTGNVGYIKMHKFHPDHMAKQVASEAFAFLSRSNALIVDLRDSGGGSPSLVQHIISHFVPQGTILWDLHGKGGELEARITSYYIEGTNSFINTPLYILTSDRVASAPEILSYTLKHLKRAVVIGEKTAGLAHYTGAQKINDWLFIRIPMGRPVSPITKTNWEQKGVSPHYRVDADSALDWTINYHLSSLNNNGAE
ncbi:S41 family peptidase [Pseudoalteromonas sp. MMG012]|uniref:S41 family peptidase n=1 Tax=Pseudoalteromonas sp. MMG012 TaxID=2822686 RepID=UPI0028A227C3|nr:S41 family peptidase [Pseudoalteromonas sp. MMG012]